jgi:hypothetical protein
MIVLEEIPTAGDQLDLRLPRTLDDPLQRGSQVVPALVGACAEKALAGEGSVEVQVSEMQ